MGNTTLVGGRVYTPITDYDILSQDVRNVTELKEKLIIGSFIRAFSESMDVAEQTLWQMLTQRSLSTAKGQNLDMIGNLLGVYRIPPTMNDTDYLTKILTEINVRRSDSTPDTILKIMKIVHNTSLQGCIFEHIYPKAGGVCVKVVTKNYVTDAPHLMKKISPAAIGSVMILKDQTDLANCFTPAEVGGGVDLIITDNNDSIVTDTAQALVALQGGGIVQDDGKGSSLLSEEFVTSYQLSVDKETVENDLWVTKATNNIPDNYAFHVQKEGMDNMIGIFAEVQQLRYDNDSVEG